MISLSNIFGHLANLGYVITFGNQKKNVRRFFKFKIFCFLAINKVYPKCIFPRDFYFVYMSKQILFTLKPAYFTTCGVRVIDILLVQ